MSSFGHLAKKPLREKKKGEIGRKGNQEKNKEKKEKKREKKWGGRARQQGRRKEKGHGSKEKEEKVTTSHHGQPRTTVAIADVGKAR